MHGHGFARLNNGMNNQFCLLISLFLVRNQDNMKAHRLCIYKNTLLGFLYVHQYHHLLTKNVNDDRFPLIAWDIYRRLHCSSLERIRFFTRIVPKYKNGRGRLATQVKWDLIHWDRYKTDVPTLLGKRRLALLSLCFILKEYSDVLTPFFLSANLVIHLRCISNVVLVVIKNHLVLLR